VESGIYISSSSVVVQWFLCTLRIRSKVSQSCGHQKQPFQWSIPLSHTSRTTPLFVLCARVKSFSSGFVVKLSISRTRRYLVTYGDPLPACLHVSPGHPTSFSLGVSSFAAFPRSLFLAQSLRCPHSPAPFTSQSPVLFGANSHQGSLFPEPFARFTPRNERDCIVLYRREQGE
jgi:hypothetical protein